MSSASKISDLFKVRFLVSEDSLGNWGFIFYLTFLAIVMIASSHSADKKVYEIAEINLKVKELRSEFVDTRKRLMQEKMESSVARKMLPKGIRTSSVPPTKIVVK
jgi:hypothetical protein